MSDWGKLLTKLNAEIEKVANPKVSSSFRPFGSNRDGSCITTYLGKNEELSSAKAIGVDFSKSTMPGIWLAAKWTQRSSGTDYWQIDCYKLPDGKYSFDRIASSWSNGSQSSSHGYLHTYGVVGIFRLKPDLIISGRNRNRG